MFRAALALFLLPAVVPASEYERTLEQLSEPAATRSQHFAVPYFSTNEKLLNRFYPRFDGIGGVTVGVSFQQNLSLLVHARPKLCVIFDYNPALTEVLIPFMGDILQASPTRREFLSTLLGADITEQETFRLLNGASSVTAVLTAVLDRTDPAQRKARLDRLRARLKGENAKWIDILQNEELLTGAFFSDAIGGGGWLSTEPNYALVRTYWMTNRIIGVTGDIGGSSVAKLGAYLRARHLEVTALYLSNVGISTEGHFPETWFRDLYHTLSTQLPVTPNALTLIAQGPWQLTGYVRTLKQAVWVYDQLAGVPEQIAIRLHEAPLEILVQSGRAQMVAALRKELTDLHAAPEYFKMLEGVEPADKGSPVYKALHVTLVEAGNMRR